eukprot:comp23937_c2_seq1/m.42290 comp23937_c2_seq1/g.42290  ORF comp23937_c2_seq1/g.42290 comp23937_c2_seq1/m.42290 type:complete len:165 (-) comp23937_c2_seq1:1096-1590(-)
MHAFLAPRSALRSLRISGCAGMFVETLRLMPKAFTVQATQLTELAIAPTFRLLDTDTLAQLVNLRRLVVGVDRDALCLTGLCATTKLEVLHVFADQAGDGGVTEISLAPLASCSFIRELQISTVFFSSHRNVILRNDNPAEALGRIKCLTVHGVTVQDLALLSQ